MNPKRTVKLEIKVTPKSSTNRIEIIDKGKLKISIKSPPDKGKANAELVSILSKFFKIPKMNIKIVKGLHSRNKLIQISDVDEKDIESLFNIR